MIQLLKHRREDWWLIAPLLPNKPRRVGRIDDRRCVNGILRTEGRLDVAPAAGAPRTVCDSLQSVQLLSQGRDLAADIRDAGDPLAAVATVARQLHPRPPACRRRKRGLGTPSAVLGTNHQGSRVVVDEQGLPVKQCPDKAAAPAMLEEPPTSHAVIADRVYDWQHLVASRTSAPNAIASSNAQSIAKSITSNLIERFFKKLQHFRCIATRRTTGLQRNFLAAVAIASVRPHIRIMSHPMVCGASAEPADDGPRYATSNLPTDCTFAQRDVAEHVMFESKALHPPPMVSAHLVDDMHNSIANVTDMIIQYVVIEYNKAIAFDFLGACSGVAHYPVECVITIDVD